MSDTSPLQNIHRASSSVAMTRAHSRPLQHTSPTSLLLTEIPDLRLRCEAALVNIRNAQIARDRYLEHARGLLIPTAASSSLLGSDAASDNENDERETNNESISTRNVNNSYNRNSSDSRNHSLNNLTEKCRKSEKNGNVVNIQKHKDVIDESIISLKNYLDRSAALADDVQESAHLAESGSLRVSLLDQLLIRVEEAKTVVSAQQCMRKCVRAVQGALLQDKWEEAAKTVKEYYTARRTLKEIMIKEERAREDDSNRKGLSSSSRLVRVNTTDEARGDDKGEGDSEESSEGDAAFFEQQADDDSWYLVPLKGDSSHITSNIDNISYDSNDAVRISSDAHGPLVPHSNDHHTLGHRADGTPVQPHLSNTDSEIYGHRIIRYAKKKILAAFADKMQAAMAINKREEVERYSKLLSELSHSKKDKICAQFVEWVCASSIDELSTMVNDELTTLKVVKNTERSHLFSASMGLDHVVATLEKEEEFVKTVFHFEGLEELLRHLHERCTQHVARIIRDYLSSRKIISITPADGRGPTTSTTAHRRTVSFSNVNKDYEDVEAARHLDRTLEEISHLVSCCYLYVTFMTNKHKEVAIGLRQEKEKRKEGSGDGSVDVYSIGAGGRLDTKVPIREVTNTAKGTSVGTSLDTKALRSSSAKEQSREGYSALVTKDNPLFEAIQELLGVYIPMQRDYFSEAVRRSQQLDKEAMEKFRLHLQDQAQAVMTRYKKDTAISSAGSGFFSGLMGGTAGGANAALSSIFGKPGSFTYYTGGPLQPKEFLQAVLADSTLSSSISEGRGMSNIVAAMQASSLTLTAAIGLSGAAGQSSPISPFVSSVIEVSVPDVMIVDDLFYVLRIALFRAFSTKNETIASSVILAIIETISEDISDEVFIRRLGTSKESDVSGNQNKNSSSVVSSTPAASGYFDIDPITMSPRCNTSSSGHGASGSGSPCGGTKSSGMVPNISPRTLRWLAAAFQMKEYTLRLARDGEMAAQQYFSDSDYLPFQKSDIGNSSQSQQITNSGKNNNNTVSSQERSIPIRFREQMKDMEHLANTTIHHLLEDTIAEMGYFTALVLLEPVLGHMAAASYRCEERELKSGKLMLTTHTMVHTRDRSSGADSKHQNNANSNNEAVNAASSGGDCQHYLSSALSVWSTVVNYLTDQLSGRTNGGGRAAEEALEKLLEETIIVICREIEQIFLPYVSDSSAGGDNVITKPNDPHLMPKEMTIFGALLLDKEIRTIRSFFIENTDVSGVRESFGRLMAICSVLVVDNISDISTVCSGISVLTPSDKKRLLMSRVDLDQKAIAKMIIA